jgi:UDP-N-acetylmuramoylalanine--D-glutamate ligase
VLGDEAVMPVADVPVFGQHNLANALAAFAICHELGVPLADLPTGISGFHGLDHRMQLVPTTDGLRWINDSKATNVAAAIASIESVSDPLVLVAGGDGKGAKFAELAAALAGRDVKVVLLGKDAGQIRAALGEDAAAELVVSMEAAVKAAAKSAESGTTILLAPACSSLDMYADFEDRGASFVAAIRELGQ